MFRCKSCGAVNRVAHSRIDSAPVVLCGRCKTPLDLSGTPQDVNAGALARTLQSSPVPVLVDFWVPWCQPFRVSGPIVDEVARHHYTTEILLLLYTHTNTPHTLLL